MLAQAFARQLGHSRLSDYEKTFKIGGPSTYGSVYQAIYKPTGERVAMKKMFSELAEDGFTSSSMRQISLLNQLESPHIVRLLDVLIEGRSLYLVMEFVDSDLQSFLRRHGPFRPDVIKNIMYQLLLGLHECHSKRIIHRDLKPSNLLISEHMHLKIADFGLARTYQIPIRPYTQDVVTLYYRAPQILLGSEEYSTPIDIWSVGCIFAELFTGTLLFDGDSQIDMIFRIFRTLGTPRNEDWPGVEQLPHCKSRFPVWPKKTVQEAFGHICQDQLALDLLKELTYCFGKMQGMLCYDPNMRITTKQALKHQYFASIRGCTNYSN